MSYDAINAFFEIGGSLFVLASVVKLYKDKQVHGVSWVTVIFFCAFGYWNIAYYPSLEQWYSTAGAIALATMNTIWLTQILYYRRIA